MSDLVERVAAAIGKAVYSHISWANLDNDARDDCRFSARAAIAAMEADTEWEYSVGYDNPPGYWDNDGAEVYDDIEDAREAYERSFGSWLDGDQVIHRRKSGPWLPVPDSEEKTDGDA